LERLYHGLGAVDGVDAPLDQAADITEAANAGDALAIKAVERFRGLSGPCSRVS
jgi:glucokinase